MKKLLLTIILIMAIFQMVVLATAIDIGAGAITAAQQTNNSTIIDKNNPADYTGKITSVEIYTQADMTGIEVATFFVVSGNYLSTRDSEAIPGTVSAGAKRTFTVDLDVVAGDFIGIYLNTSGYLYYTKAGAGIWIKAASDQIPCTNYNFGTAIADRAISLYGTGATAAVGGNAIMMGINF